MYKDIQFLRFDLGAPKKDDRADVVFIKHFVYYLNNLLLSVGDELLRRKLYQMGKKIFLKESKSRGYPRSRGYSRQ
jgi:hypothetical protein